MMVRENIIARPSQLNSGGQGFPEPWISMPCELMAEPLEGFPRVYKNLPQESYMLEPPRARCYSAYVYISLEQIPRPEIPKRDIFPLFIARVAAMKDKANAENGMLPGGPDQEVKEITSVDPIGDFKKMVNDRKVDRVNDAIVQMAAIIERFVKNSLKGDLYEKALQCLQELRATCIKEDEGGRYNEFLHRIKKMFMTGTYIIDTWCDFYQLLCANGKHLSLVTHRETPTSSFVTDEESVKFLQLI